MNIKDAYAQGYRAAVVETIEKMAASSGVEKQEVEKKLTSSMIEKNAAARDILYPMAGAGLVGLPSAALGAAGGGLLGVGGASLLNEAGISDIDPETAGAILGGLGGLTGLGLGGALGYTEGKDEADEAGARSAANKALRQALESGEMGAKDIGTMLDLTRGAATRGQPPQISIPAPTK